MAQMSQEEQIQVARMTVFKALAELKMSDWISLLVLDGVRADLLSNMRTVSLQRSVFQKQAQKGEESQPKQTHERRPADDARM